MQRQLRDAIKDRYGVSNRTSNQVINALTEIEKHRQGKVVGLPGRPGTQQEEQQQMPDIETIVGGVSGSGYSAQGGGILGLIMSLVLKLLGLGRSGQSQGGQDIMNILGDLMGGATNPDQAPDLASILGGLLGSGGSTTGSSSQAPDIEDLVMGLLSGQVSSRGGRTSKKSR